MAQLKFIPVLLLTGYLGSGKTTLLNRILANRRGIRFAVVVNDIGEVNIDAELIERGGIISQGDENLVALQNGCICCTLKTDLINQLAELCTQDRFDYIVIEASGICEPLPIAQTICSMPQVLPVTYRGPLPRLDAIVTVVDALRMQSEFDCGDALRNENIDDEDLEKLVIEQIEFCNIVLLNKASEVTKYELEKVEKIVKTLNPGVKIFTCDYGDIELDNLLSTNDFDFDKVATSATWIREIEHKNDHDDDDDDDDEDHDHDHHHEHEEHHDHHEHHHHHHDHDEGEAEEYGIGTYVYFRRKPLNLNRFDYLVSNKWPKNIIRAKGLCYFDDDLDKCLMFEQAGVQKTVREIGNWFATMPRKELDDLMRRDATLRKDWDDQYGDRMIKIVFIGQHLDKAEIDKLMDDCIV